MDDDVDPNARHEPVALYEGPKLIAFRGWPLLVVVGAAILFGVAFDRGVLALGAWLDQRAATRAQHATRDALGGGRLAAAQLRTADGATAPLLPGRAQVVHVWLQGCADCMTAFRAMQKLRQDGGLGDVVVRNVAYGRADVDWARTYGVDDDLAFDEGAAVVQPLGIGTFTTLVVAADGTITWRDRPDRDGFTDRVRAAYFATLASDTHHTAP